MDNVLRLLLVFRDQQQLRLSDVAAKLGVSPSTAHRLLAMLVHHEFVHQQGGRGVYTAGPALLEIGYGAVRSLDLRSLAQPILARLAENIDETVHLAQLEGGHIRYLAGAESSRPLRVADRTGQLFPAHQTATGKAILAGLTPAQLTEVLAGAAGTDWGPLSTAKVADLEEELAGVRVAGFALNHREDDVISVAVAVRNRRGLAVAAINASAPASRMPGKRQREVVEALRTAADELGSALGTV
ncbi:IclR family transcriptional regulator [Micromonospora sp. NPDC023966]|uniref:IclR family transcriptional regulator n=1 Tax=Micromonospora sp. NPDC023966 TaxID=3154699 RepID=UPI0033DE44ED